MDGWVVSVMYMCVYAEAVVVVNDELVCELELEVEEGGGGGVVCCCWRMENEGDVVVVVVVLVVWGIRLGVVYIGRGV